MRGKKKKILVFGYFGFNNFGDDLMLKNTLDYFETQKSDYIFNVFVKENYYQSLNSFTTFRHIKVNYIKLNSFVNYISVYYYVYKSRLGFWLGGTCLYESKHSDISGLVWLKRIISVFKILKKNFFFCNIGVGDIKTIKAKSLYDYIINNTKSISCRDEKSINILENSNLDVKFSLGGDLASLLKIKEQIRTKEYIIFSGHYQYSDDDDLVKLYARNLDKLSKCFNKKVLFFPMHQGGLTDNVFHEKISKLMSCENIIVNFNFDNYESFLERGFFWLSMRLHGVVLADMLNIPNLGIAYQEKVRVYVSKTEVLSTYRVKSVGEFITDSSVEYILNAYKKPLDFLNEENRRSLNGLSILEL